MKGDKIEVRWQSRDEPRIAVGAVATRGAAERLVRKILDFDDALLARWRGVSRPETIILLGEEESLPWIDGIVYISRDPRAPKLLLPTNRDPDIPLDLLERALIRHCPFSPPLVALDQRVISVSEAREVSRATLLSWLGSK